MNVDPEAGCDATSESVVGRRTKLVSGFIMEHQWHAGLLAAGRRLTSNATNVNQRKPVSYVIAPHRGGWFANNSRGCVKII